MQTLRVVTAREIVILSASLSPTQRQCDGTAIYMVMQATRDSVSTFEGREMIYTSLSGTQRGLNLGLPRDGRARLLDAHLSP